MAINETGAIYKSLTYGGKTSREFGVYITGEGVYNAPERDVEMIDIPGRNGAYALDHGRFSNIEIEYPCSIAADNETDYREALSDFRNWLCSQKGYVRLTDDYNPDEYRLAVYKSGLEVETVQQTAGEFTITFEAKPQRFLTSGETAITVSQGQHIVNPTLFDSKPLLEIYGDGAIGINGDRITVVNDYIGEVVVKADSGMLPMTNITTTIDTQYANTGDTITMSAGFYTNWQINSGTISNAVAQSDSYGESSITKPSAKTVSATISISDFIVNYGTAGNISTTATYTITSSAYGTITGTIILTIAYDGTDGISITTNITSPSNMSINNYRINLSDVILNSTQYSLGTPLYIDLELGEAYKIEGDSAVSVNNAVTMPAQIPSLTPGDNIITFSAATITRLDIIPRYWTI